MASIHGVTQIHTAKDARIVVYLATRNLYDLLPAAYTSLLTHTRVDRVFLLVEDDRLPFRLPEKVSCVNVSGQTFFPKDGPNYGSRYTYMTLMKTAIPQIFPNTEKVLVLDVDTIVWEDIGGLWDYDLTGKYYAAVPEVFLSRKLGRTYCNAGVLMLNLGMFRETHRDEQLMIDLNTRKLDYTEQDALHELCGDRFVELPATYNMSSVTKPDGVAIPTEFAVQHFACMQEWWRERVVQEWLLNAYRQTYGYAPRSVVYIGNRKVYGMMLSAAKSLMYRSPVDRVYFLIEDDKFPEPLPEMFRCVNVSGQQIFSTDGPNYHPHYSCMTTLRAALGQLLPDEKRVLLLDPDTVVVDDISGIWNYDVTDYYFAAVQEIRNNNHTKVPYYNAGVMLLNLEKLRLDGMEEQLIHEINTVHYEHLEQDVMNYLCDRKILDLPSCYNASFVSEPCRYPRIMHFLSHAKRFFPEAAAPYAGMSWEKILNRKGDVV